MSGLTCLALALVASPLPCLAAGPATLPAPIAAALQAAGVPASAVSFMVLPAEGGAARLAHQGDTVRQVASVMKLFTTGAALNSLGPTFTWRTDVALGGTLQGNGTLDGPLYVRGSGDPSLVIEKVQLMMTRWQAAGLRHINGDMVLDRSAFDVPPHDPAAFDGMALKPYNAGPDGLLLNYQSISLRFAPDAARPGQVQVSMEPELDGVTLKPQLHLEPTGACGDWREGLALSITPVPGWRHDGRQRWTVAVQGPYPLACGERDWPVLWQGDGPGDHAQRLLDKAWRQAGGKLSGTVRLGPWPDKAVAWQHWESPPLAAVVRDINKYSNNVMARQLFLAMSPPPGPATLDKARVAITQQVLAATQDGAGHSPCADGALVLDNGSGLSRKERSSAACLGRWLQVLWASPLMPELVSSLPITGIDGTARRLSSIAGRAHMKTGSLDGVAAMAGIVDGDSGHRHVVVGIINHVSADAARPALEALVAWAMHDKAAQN